MSAAVSLCLIARNEEADLPACLASAADLVGEVVVVDTGSADRTKEVAASFGAKVCDFPWCDDFAAARNESLRHATRPWAFWLDADERIDEPNRDKLRALFAGLTDENAAYVMKCHCLPDAQGKGGTVVDHVRLFRNRPDVRWQYRVHEQVLPGLRQAGADVRWADVVIRHAGYQDPIRQRQKTERNLRLLHLEDAERPGDPFTLFNLGWTCHELGRHAEALPYLQASLERSGPHDSIVRKLYALLARVQRRLGRPGEALRACRAGRARLPDDAELLFLEGQLLREHGDRAGAVALWRQIVEAAPAAHFASVDAGLRGHLTRYHLGLAYREQGQHAEAEAQWRAAVADEPGFGPAWVGLAELYLGQQRWDELAGAVAALRQAPGTAVEAAVLAARGHLARQEFAEARRLLEEAIAAAPEAVGPRVFLTHVLLQEGGDPAAAERALRDLVARDPGEAEAWRNLAVLLWRQGRKHEAEAVCRSGRAHRPHDADLLLQHGRLLSELGDVVGAEACFLRLLEVGARPHGTTARHQLALIYRGQRRWAEAEAQWRAALAERPDLAAAWLGLGELYLGQGRWAELEAVAERLAQEPVEAAVLRARGHLARREFAAARDLLGEVIAGAPEAVWPRVVLSQVLLQEGRDWEAAERALWAVLRLDPGNAEARHNLALLRQQGRAAEG